MNIKQDWGFSPEEVDTQETLPLTLDEAFHLDERINSIEDLVEVTQKMNDRVAYGEKPESYVIIAGHKFKRAEVELWMVDQEFVNPDSDGQNSPDSELEDEMKAYKVTKYVSLPDLVSTLKGAGMDGSKLSGDDLLEVLWLLGLDTKDYKVIERVDTHRTSDNKAVTCLRYICSERMDKEWLESGMATFEAKLEASGDASLNREIASIGRR